MTGQNNYDKFGEAIFGNAIMTRLEAFSLLQKMIGIGRKLWRELAKNCDETSLFTKLEPFYIWCRPLPFSPFKIRTKVSLYCRLVLWQLWRVFRAFLRDNADEEKKLERAYSLTSMSVKARRFSWPRSATFLMSAIFLAGTRFVKALSFVKALGFLAKALGFF